MPLLAVDARDVTALAHARDWLETEHPGWTEEQLHDALEEEAARLVRERRSAAHGQPGESQDARRELQATLIGAGWRLEDVLDDQDVPELHPDDALYPYRLALVAEHPEWSAAKVYVEAGALWRQLDHALEELDDAAVPALGADDPLTPQRIALAEQHPEWSALKVYVTAHRHWLRGNGLRPR